MNAISALTLRSVSAEENKNVQSLNRELQRSLYLVVSTTSSPSWTFPSLLLNDQELLHEVFGYDHILFDSIYSKFYDANLQPGCFTSNFDLGR